MKASRHGPGSPLSPVSEVAYNLIKKSINEENDVQHLAEGEPCPVLSGLLKGRCKACAACTSGCRGVLNR